MASSQSDMHGMEGKTCLVTGATAGIGLVTAIVLARRGARVLIVGRNAERIQRALALVRTEQPQADHASFLADLASQAEVARLAEEVRAATPKLDLLINNAGAMFFDRQETVDGYERTFGLNHLAYFALTAALIEPLRTAGGRIVNVASEAHRGARGIRFDDIQMARGYRGWPAYCHSKLANVMFTAELAKRLEGSGVTANSLHPGFVRSDFFVKPGIRWWFIRQGARLAAISPERGAETSVYLASSPEVANASGGYYDKCRKVEPSEYARDPEAARRLWDVSADLTQKFVRLVI